MRIARIKGTPKKMGTQFGEQMRNVLSDRLNRTIKGALVIETTSTGQKSHTLEQVSKVAEKFEDAIQRKFPEFIEYMEGMSIGAGIAFEQLRNVAFGYMPPPECCCFA